MRHAFVLTAGALTAALVGAATLFAAGSAKAGPLMSARSSAETASLATPARCSWRHGHRYCYGGFFVRIR